MSMDQSPPRPSPPSVPASKASSVAPSQLISAPPSPPHSPPPRSRTTILLLPPELLTAILSFLPLAFLLAACHAHPYILSTAAHPSLNPFRPVLLRLLRAHAPYPRELAGLACFPWVPRANWIELLVHADAGWLAEVCEIPPGLGEKTWEEAFRRRFLPGWIRWKGKNDSWRTVFIRLLHRIAHRRTVTCTSDESWTSFLLLHRTGTLSLNRSPSRHLSPLHIFAELKRQANAFSLPTRIRSVLRLNDVRIIVLGVRGSSGSLFVNPSTRALLDPHGATAAAEEGQRLERWRSNPDEGVAPQKQAGRRRSAGNLFVTLGSAFRPGRARAGTINVFSPPRAPSPPASFGTRLLPAEHKRREIPPPTHPTPHFSETEYPNAPPPGDADLTEEWVGPLLIAAQLIQPGEPDDVPLVADDSAAYASLTVDDLFAIAPWMKAHVLKTAKGLGY